MVCGGSVDWWETANPDLILCWDVLPLFISSLSGTHRWKQNQPSNTVNWHNNSLCGSSCSVVDFNQLSLFVLHTLVSPDGLQTIVCLLLIQSPTSPERVPSPDLPLQTLMSGLNRMLWSSRGRHFSACLPTVSSVVRWVQCAKYVVQPVCGPLFACTVVGLWASRLRRVKLQHKKSWRETVLITMKSVTAVTVYAFHAVLPFLVSSAVSPCSIPPQSKLEECKLVRLGVCENPLSPLHLNFIHRRAHLQEHERFSSNYNCRHGTRVLQISSTHPSSPTYLGLGCGGSNLSREAHTSLPPVTTSS